MVYYGGFAVFSFDMVFCLMCSSAIWRGRMTWDLHSLHGLNCCFSLYFSSGYISFCRDS
jgi:hypothetical protein